MLFSYLSICTFEFWVGILVLFGVFIFVFIRLIRIILCMFYVCLFDFKCLSICYRYIFLRKGFLLFGVIDVLGDG